MQALILNSGTGSRMGDLTKDKPKCLIEIFDDTTILDFQIRSLIKYGINDFIITTGFYDELIQSEVKAKRYSARFTFVKNPVFDKTNYIYSMFLARSSVKEDIILMHGDMVFDEEILADVIKTNYENAVIVDKSGHIPEKDFKARIKDGFVTGISIHYQEDCKFLLPVYKVSYNKMSLWFDEIEKFINAGNDNVYAEEAFNNISSNMDLNPFYIENRFCIEIDTAGDYNVCKKWFDRD